MARSPTIRHIYVQTIRRPPRLKTGDVSTLQLGGALVGRMGKHTDRGVSEAMEQIWDDHLDDNPATKALDLRGEELEGGRRSTASGESRWEPGWTLGHWYDIDEAIGGAEQLGQARFQITAEMRIYVIFICNYAMAMA